MIDMHIFIYVIHDIYDYIIKNYIDSFFEILTPRVQEFQHMGIDHEGRRSNPCRCADPALHRWHWGESSGVCHGMLWYTDTDVNSMYNSIYIYNIHMTIRLFFECCFWTPRWYTFLWWLLIMIGRWPLHTIVTWPSGGQQRIDGGVYARATSQQDGAGGVPEDPMQTDPEIETLSTPSYNRS